MEEIIAITLIFGGGGALLFSLSPIGRAIAARIKGGGAMGNTDVRELQETVHDLLEDNLAIREELVEVQERMEFTERLLSSKSDEK